MSPGSLTVGSAPGSLTVGSVPRVVSGECSPGRPGRLSGESSVGSVPRVAGSPQWGVFCGECPPSRLCVSRTLR